MSGLRSFLAALLLGVPVGAGAVDPDDLLPVDEAFAISAEAVGPDSVRLTWDVAEGYYLYRHRFGFESETSNVTLGDVQLPPGKPHVDEFFGRVETYRDEVSALIPVSGATPGQHIEITAQIQGCADLGVCYPPHEQIVALSLPIAADPKSGPPLPNPLPPAGGEGIGNSEPESLSPPTERATSNADSLSTGEERSTSNADSPPFSEERATSNADSHSPSGERAGVRGEIPGQAIFSQPAGTPFNLGGEELLLPDEAFRFEAIALEPTLLGVRLTAAPGYYLYRGKIDFALRDAEGVTIDSFSLPPGEPKVDPHFGDVNVYYGLVEIPVSLQRDNASAQTLDLVGRFQGCKEDSVCYPPMERTLNVRLPKADAASLSAGSPATGGGTVTTPLTEQDRLAETLLAGNLWWALALFFLAGLLLAFTPCVFPMVPILAGILAGQGERLTTRRAFTLSLVYVLCVALTYTVAGVIAGLFGQNLQALFQQPWILITFAAVFVLLALSMFGYFELQLPARWQTKISEISHTRKGGTYAGVALMGLLSALIVGPCVAPPLAAALIVIGQQGDPVLGGAALFALSMGMGLPLLILGASAGKLLPVAGPWMETVKKVFGVLLLALAIWMLSRILPATIAMLLWSVLFVTCAAFLFAAKHTIWKALGLILLLLGALELIGAAAGGGTWLRPLYGLRSGAPAESIDFQPVASAEALDGLLAEAADRGTPVLLDFYADWCVECKRMEAYTFPDPAVQQALDNALLLKADVTEMDAGDKSLLERFGLIGPPATLFFVNGQELRQHRLIGYLDGEAFAEHVEHAFR